MTTEQKTVIAELYQRQLTADEMARAVLEFDALVRSGEQLQRTIDSASFADTGAGSRGSDEQTWLRVAID